MDETPVDLSGPMDLTFKKENPDMPPAKRNDELYPPVPDVRSTHSFSPSENLRDPSPRLAPAFPLGIGSVKLLQPLSSPILSEAENQSKEMAGHRARLTPPIRMISPCLNSPPATPVNPASPASSLGHRQRTLTTPPLLQSAGAAIVSPENKSTGKSSNAKRYMSASRPFNVLAKKLIGEIDCPPRPGTKELSPSGTTPQGDSETDAAYRERRSKNNLAARRSRDKRKLKCSLLTERRSQCKQQSVDILEEISSLQQILIENKGYQRLPYREEISFLQDELYMYS